MLFKHNIDKIDFDFSYRRPLPSFQNIKKRQVEIHQDMTSNEISEVVSDKIIETIREQFKTAKQEFKKTAKKK
jgi:hypothetical protein